ncbi:GyrI-like domain-containing protein [Mucilaginibacter antarcticus]|uniref:GyrI-like domain-containing protein n=1 Tax=Mucilaginibacter antarcticus TaxID=1855725 RepID=A0ABW5XMB2_9SPHI
MASQQIAAFNVIGVAVRTTNQNSQMAIDIPSLWGKFMSEGILSKIPNKVDDTIYCIYTDYEKDHTLPYTAIIGCKVADLSQIPEGMVGHAIGETSYQKFIAEGDLLEGAVYYEWTRIWSLNISRSYTSDFEVYTQRSQDPVNPTVDIFIALK